MMAATQSVVSQLEGKAERYRGDGEEEMARYGRERENTAGPQFNTWLRKVVKLFIQEELMRAKTHQVDTPLAKS